MAPLKSLRIVAVGKLKTPHWKMAADHYLERLKHWRNIQQAIIKDAPPSLPTIQRNAMEGEHILAALTPQDIPVVLDEKGKGFNSASFALFLEKISENAASRPCFIIGGAFGLSPTVREQARDLVRRGEMTFPHELARVVLLEQLYRAEAILRNVPYHME